LVNYNNYGEVIWLAETTLVIVESAAKAKTLSKFLGKTYRVKASVGHIKDLPKSKLGIDVDNDFEPQYITIRGKGDILKEIRDESQKAKRVLLATDPDREGEAIAWHLQNVLKIPADAKCRVEFYEITKDAVKNAIKKPRPIDLNRVNAQQTRRMLDRLVGYKLSPLLWSKVRKGLSAGRVQSVVVRLICEREEEIRQFVPEEYWSIEAHLQTKDEKSLVAKLINYGDKKMTIPNADEKDRIINELSDCEYIVTQIEKREKRKKPLPPFTTSTLQQESSKRLNFFSQRTMRVAQELYEGLELGKEAQLVRHLPRTLEIKVTERVMWAVIPAINEFLIIDSEGVCINKSLQFPTPEIPVITVDPVPQQIIMGQAVEPQGVDFIRKIWDELSEQERAQISDFHFTSTSQELIIYTAEGTEIRFGKKERLDEKLSVISQVFKLEQEFLEAGQDALVYVDVRYKGQPVVKTTS
jgi:reverse gyrase